MFTHNRPGEGDPDSVKAAWEGMSAAFYENNATSHYTPFTVCAKFMIDTCYIETAGVHPSNRKLAMRSSFCPKSLFSLFYVLFLLQKLALRIPTGKQLLIYFACSFNLITQILLRDSQSLLFGRTMITQFKTTMSKVSS